MIAAASSLVWLDGRKKTPEQREILRRQRISAQGRITDGTVLDVQEFNSDAGHPAQMVMYTYDVAGVQYECSQEVTHLRQFPGSALLPYWRCRQRQVRSLPSRQLDRHGRRLVRAALPRTIRSRLDRRLYGGLS